MKKRTVFFVSDQTGITAETLGQSLLTQFEDVSFRRITLPFIASVDKAREAVVRINLTAQVEGFRPIVFATFVQEGLRDIVAQSDGLFLDFFGAFINPLERELESKSSHTTGRAHGRADTASYLRRIDAINFAMENDDGMRVDGYDKAEVILVGVSRCGKTPTCLYLALQNGVYAANFPLTEDEFESRRLPKAIESHKGKLFGLTIQPAQLRQIRDERRPDSKYASVQQVNFEIREALSLYQRYGVPYMDTTHTSVEEIAARILHEKKLRHRSLEKL